MKENVTVATVDNHPIVREGIALHLAAIDGIEVVSSTATAEELLASPTRPDVVLLDLLLTDGDTIDQIPALVAIGARVLIYTTEERPVPLRRCVAAGACGVLLKNDPIHTVVQAIRDAMEGEFCVSGPLAHALITDPSLVADLSERQRQILQCIDEGLDYHGTGRVLGCSKGVVKTHLARIRDKYRSLGVEPGNSHHLARLAYDEGHLR